MIARNSTLSLLLLLATGAACLGNDNVAWEKYQKVRVGMTLAEVVAILGDDYGGPCNANGFPGFGNWENPTDAARQR